MIYTCYDMARDCRAGKPEGWSYFISHYVPAIRKLVQQYPAANLRVEDVLLAVCKPQSKLFQALEPAPERWFVADLRQVVLDEVKSRDAEIPLELETLAAALEPLTVVEKQVVWLETMGYSAATTGVMMRMAPSTVEKIRIRAGELIRGKSDAWRSSILADNGFALGRAAAAAGGEDCLPRRDFVDVLDGRTTWPQRDRMTRHVNACWHCIDHFCRLVEVAELLRDGQLLPAKEAAPFLQLLGVPVVKQRLSWKRLLGGA